MNVTEIILKHRRTVYWQVVQFRTAQGTLWSDDDFANTIFLNILQRPPSPAITDVFSWVRDRAFSVLCHLATANKSLKRSKQVRNADALATATAKQHDLDIRMDVESMLSHLGERTREIVRRYYGIDRVPTPHLQEIAKQLHMSQPSVREMFISALKRMKTMLGGD